MRTVSQHLSWSLCVLLGTVSAPAQESVLNAIPDDALAFGVVHNLTEASRSVDGLAELLRARAPDLLRATKEQAGIENGLDEQGDAAIVLTSVDPEPTVVLLAPVEDFAAFFAGLGVKDPAAGVVKVQVAGSTTLVGRKGDYVAFASPRQRDGLERFLTRTTSLASDAQLVEWLGANQASVVVTPRGIKQLLPKLTAGIRAFQGQIRAVAGANGEVAAAGLNPYVELFAAAEAEVERLSLGVRIDSAQTVQLIELVQFTPDGNWAKWAADAKPAEEDLLAGLPAGPFVMALGGVFPQGAMDRLMKFSVQMMQNQPGFQLTPEQAQRYVELSTTLMHGVRSMRMVLGVAEPGTGLYGNTSAVMIVDDSQRFIDDYEKSLSAMHELAQETKSPLIPVATSQRISLGETEALEVSMEMQQMKAVTVPGGPDMQKMMELMFGTNGKLLVYVAPVDEHAVLMAYTSLERLQAALDFYKAKRPGLSGDAGVAKVAAVLPSGSQFVAYVSLSGVAEVAPQFATTVPGGRAAAIPDLPDCPPLGIAAKVSPSGIEGHLIVTAETLRAIGDVVAKARGAASGPSPSKQ